MWHLRKNEISVLRVLWGHSQLSSWQALFLQSCQNADQEASGSNVRNLSHPRCSAISILHLLINLFSSSQSAMLVASWPLCDLICVLVQYVHKSLDETNEPGLVLRRRLLSDKAAVS